VARYEVGLEFPGDHIPAILQSVPAAGLWIERQCALRGAPQVLVERARHPVVDHVDRSGHGVRGHRHAAGHRLEIHEPEGVGTTGKDHDVGGGQMPGEILLEAVPRESHVRILALEAHALGTVADHDLAAAPRHLQERLDVLFDRNAPHVGGERPWQVEKIL